MNKPLIFLDFDETLFNHYAYMDWADAYLEKYGVKPGEYRGSVDSFHTHMGEKLRLYRHEDHIISATGKSWSYISGEFEKELISNDHDFCYEDTHAFLEQVTSMGHDVRILTYGNGEYQHYKMKTCRHLAKLRIPVHVVNQPKRVFLVKNFSETSGVLLDDKYPLNLQEPWRHIWINRKDPVVKPVYQKDTHSVQISGLDQFNEALDLITEKN